MPLNEFIWKIYLDTGYYNYASLMPNGVLRAGNLKMLFEKAKQYEKTSFKGLYNFISFIDKLKLSSNDMSGAKLIGENEDVVRIMSIHKSKGLEFPVVFLCGTSKRFNMTDINQNSILLHQDLGFGPKYINYEEGESYTTLMKEAIKVKTREEMLSEEMRVLYVALTRAKEKLIITGLEKDYKKSTDKKEELIKSYNNLNKNIIQKYITYLDWLELVYLKCKKELEEILDVKVYSKKEVLKEVSSKEEEKNIDLEERLKEINTKDVEKIKEKLEWEYGYKNADNILTKSSVTKIKNMKLDLTEEDKKEIEYKVPEFLKETKELTGAEKGSLMHLVLQKLDIRLDYDKEKVKELVEALEKKGVISKEKREAVDIEKIYNFTKTNIWREMQTAKQVEREKPFYINIPVKEIYKEDIDEDILVQGIIDLYYITKDDKLVLVDYKTDRVKEESELVEKYKGQLNLYKKALEQAMKRKVDEVYIYSVYFDREISII